MTPDDTGFVGRELLVPELLDPARAAEVARLRPLVADLADRVGLHLAEFIEIFGLGWRAITKEEIANTHGDQDPLMADWAILGEPPQLMLRTTPYTIELAQPDGWWIDDRLVIAAREVITLDRRDLDFDHASGAVAALIRKRRSTFRYCRWCGNATPPERREAKDRCYSCAEILWPRIY